jgi:Carboxypeptidase regulatory-like domain
MKKLILLVLALLVPLSMAIADKKKEDDQQSEVKFQVLKADNGKPVRNAAVILHPVGSDGHQSRKGSELKTDAQGTTEIAVPYGKVRVQVIAPGFQTYGEDVTFDAPEKTIVIKLNRPGEQYSIYK